MIRDERLEEVAGLGSESLTFPPSHSECAQMAMELLALRKASRCQHQWSDLKLVECGGRYQYCTLCGAKMVEK